jgi:hypothetical protein
MRTHSLGITQYSDEVYVKRSLPSIDTGYKKGNKINNLIISCNADIAHIWIDYNYHLIMPKNSISNYFFFPTSKIEKLLFSTKLT